MSDKGRIAIYRALTVVTTVLWFIQGWRFIHGERINSGVLGLLSIVFMGGYLISRLWSAEARQAASAQRSTNTSA